MTGTIKPEIAQAAAEWWADQLRGEVRHDNGEPMQSALATTVRKRVHGEDGIDPALIDEFETNLREQLTGTEFRGMDYTLSVDYHPCAMLTDAAEDAGIDAGMTTFPFKTTMWIESERILASVGYQSERDEIYTTDNWPPTVLDITADEVDFTIDLPSYSVEESPVSDAIEDRVARDSYEGYDHEIRELREIQVHETEIVDGPYSSTQDYCRATVTLSASVFVSEDYVQKARRRARFGIHDRVRAYLERLGSDDVEVTDGLLEALVVDALEKYDHLNVEVQDVGDVEGEFVEAW